MNRQRSVRARIVVVVAILVSSAPASILDAQTAASRDTPSAVTTGALRRDVEARFDVLLLSDGIVLRPRAASSGVKGVEVRGGAIAVDGSPVTGAELREKLGADADLVIQLSYLDGAALRALFAQPAAGSSPPPSPPESAAPSAPPPPPAPPDRRIFRRRGDREGARVRFGGSVRVDRGEVIPGDVVAFGGAANIDGRVDGDVVAIGGDVDLGPNADVSNDVVALGGQVRRDPAAKVGGQVNEVGAGQFANWKWPGSLSALWAGLFGSLLSLMTTLTRIAVLCLLAALVMLVGREYVERVSTRAAAEPLKAGAVGFLSQILFLPVLVLTVLVLVLTIVGIPLLILVPFLIVGLVIVALVGFTAIGYRVGQLVSARFGWNLNPYVTTIAGILVVLTPVMLARILGLAGGILFPFGVALGVVGTAIEYVAWTVGFGAVALVRFTTPTSPA